MTAPIASSTCTPITEGLLRAWPLPEPQTAGDKESRGAVLVVGGSRELAGALVLSGIASLRAGAGKLMMATAHSVSQTVAVAVPEARVIGLPESSGGGLDPCGVDTLASLATHIDALLIGPGLMDEECTLAFLTALRARLPRIPTVLDALALNAAALEAGFKQPVLLTPHAGEMAHLTGHSKEDVLCDPQGLAAESAHRWGAVVALKGSVTFIAAPDGRRWRHEGNDPGLGTSGSGDVLAGVAVGLLARGAPIEQAAAWAVALHARAGRRLSARIGPLGYLAREIADEIPRCLPSGGARVN